MDPKEWNRILDWYSIEDGNCCNTGSRLTMKPLAALPRFAKAKAPARPKARKKRPAPAA